MISPSANSIRRVIINDRLGRVCAVLLLALLLVPAGCGGSVTQTNPSVSGSGAASTSTVTLATPSIAPGSPGVNVGDIPAGRSFAEGGGGPLTYTFREEWRKARTEAQKWRAGACLISATSQFVNDDGVPSYWVLVFIDKTNADAVMRITIDPWGKVTKSEEVTGDGVVSFVNKFTKQIPYAIIDSDAATTAGKAALAARYNLDKTKEPSLSLGFDRVDGSGPYWTYMLFYNSTAEYVSAKINALTGEVMPSS